MDDTTYTALRHFADSWGLLFMFLFFCGIIAWVLRPGASRTYDDTANMIFRNESNPKDDADGR